MTQKIMGNANMFVTHATHGITESFLKAFYWKFSQGREEISCPSLAFAGAPPARSWKETTACFAAKHSCISCKEKTVDCCNYKTLLAEGRSLHQWKLKKNSPVLISHNNNNFIILIIVYTDTAYHAISKAYSW